MYCSIEISNKSRSISHFCAMNMSYEHIRQHWLLSLCMDKYWSVRYNNAHHMQISCVYFGENSAHKQKKKNKERNTHSSIANSSCCYALVFSFPCSHKKPRFKTWRPFSKFTCWYFCRQIWLWSVVCKSLKRMHLYLSDRTKTKLQIHIFTYACLHKAYIIFYIVFYYLHSDFVFMCKNKFSSYWENKSGLPWKYIRYVANEAM